MKTATYYIGRRTFKSKKSGQDCFMISLVYQNGSGWATADTFVDKPVFDDCATLEAGAAVDLAVVVGGRITGIELSCDFCPLPLGAEMA